MHVEPITCYRPRPDRARDFAALPYDVFDRASAAAYVAGHPGSFLEIDRPETAFDLDHDPCAEDVYARAHDLLAARVSDGTLLRDGTPCFYLWRLRSDDNEQTGIVASFSVDDYTNGVIRRHELTNPDKQADRERHIRATCCQTGPVLMAYRDNPVLEALVEAAATADALYDFTDERGVRNTIWRVARPAAVESLRLMLEYVPRAYIADGHHRAAAAAVVCREMRTNEGARHTGAEAYNYLLGVIFPASQLCALPYNRVVALPQDMSEDALVGSLREAGLTVGERRPAAVRPARPGTFGLYAFGAWRELVVAASSGDARGARDGSTTPAGAASRVDAQVLQDCVIGPVLGVTDPRTDERIRFVGGSTDARTLEGEVGPHEVALTLRPATMEEVMTVADAGDLMPPKSTWFEPKLLSGLFVRRINHREVLIDGARRAQRG